MKQKITLEIDNQTGVEFEEVAEWRLVRKGDFYVLLDEEGEGLAPNIFKATVNGCFYAPVLTPKVDHELEEAKKLIGKWVKNGRGDMAIKVANVYKNHRGEILYESKGYSVTLEHWEPFPLPVWRCCESDRPKTQGRYYTRRKRDHAERDLDEYCGENWEAINPEYISPLDYEWLDEGGK